MTIVAAEAAEVAAMKKAAEGVAKVAATATAKAKQAVDAIPARLEEFIVAVAPAEEHSTPAEVAEALLQGRLLAHVTPPYLSKAVPREGLVSRWPQQVPSEKLPASAHRQSLATLNTSQPMKNTELQPMKNLLLQPATEGQGTQGGVGTVDDPGEKGTLSKTSTSTAVVAVASNPLGWNVGKGEDPVRKEVFTIKPTERKGQVKQERAKLLVMRSEAVQMRQQVFLASSL